MLTIKAKQNADYMNKKEVSVIVSSDKDVFSYKDLTVWKKSIKLAKDIYLIVRSFPKQDPFSLGNQMERSAFSIASNIAEGPGRKGTKEYINFLSIANGSNFELETQVIIAKEIGLIKNSNEIINNINEISRMIKGLQSSLRKKLNH